MDIDIQVSKLKLMKQNYFSEKYALEDKILKYYPAEIKRHEERIKGLKEDIEFICKQSEIPKDNFAGMKIGDKLHTEKKDAGEAIFLACKNMRSPEPIRIGMYRGFEMTLMFDSLSREYNIELKHAMRYTVSLGSDAGGNIIRLENAKEEVNKPFVSEDELQQKLKRLDELNVLLSLDEKCNEIVDDGTESEEKNAAEIEQER